MTNFETITQLSNAAQWLTEAKSAFFMGTTKEQAYYDVIERLMNDIRTVINDLSAGECVSVKDSCGSVGCKACCDIYSGAKPPGWFKFCPECGKAINCDSQ